jgi:pimeloyl-ACP methyl ester carboxylesterase
MRPNACAVALVVAAVVLGAVITAGATRAATTAPASIQGTPVVLRQRWLGNQNLVRTWQVGYRAFNGQRRTAFVVLPRWYGPRNNPPLPLVISPHGRGIEPQANARFFGNLPALGPFALVSPEGAGVHLELYAWGAPGDIADLARMPQIVTHALPWLRLAPHRIYAVGGSMGGQETLLIVAEHPQLLAGAAALDSATNLAARYAAFRGLPNGIGLQQLARLEVGGVPRTRHAAYADRSPIFYANDLARSRVPLQIWWSTRDQIVVNQAAESGLLYQTIKRLNPSAPVTQVVGTWNHSAEMYAYTQLPIVLANMHLLQLAASTGAAAQI